MTKIASAVFFVKYKVVAFNSNAQGHMSTDLVHGEWYEWLKSIDIVPHTATRMIQAFEQFGKRTMSSDLEVGIIFEMLSLPESVDRLEFVEQEHTILSTGEQKTVDEMTVREVKLSSSIYIEPT